MTEFDYIAIDTAGRERSGRVKAETMEDARARLDARKLLVVRVEPAAAQAAQKRAGLSFRTARLSPKELTLFTRQLSTLIQVSPLEESLRTIGRQSEQAHVRDIVGKVHGGVLEGRRLAEAMGGGPKGSEERRVGKECVRTVRFRWGP